MDVGPELESDDVEEAAEAPAASATAVRASLEIILLRLYVVLGCLLFSKRSLQYVRQEEGRSGILEDFNRFIYILVHDGFGGNCSLRRSWARLQRSTRLWLPNVE